jgi:hypothetical protein
MLVAIQHVCLINKYQEEKFGDTKRLIRSRNSKKYMQYKGKKDKRINDSLKKFTQKIKDRATRPPK